MGKRNPKRVKRNQEDEGSDVTTPTVESEMDVDEQPTSASKSKLDTQEAREVAFERATEHRTRRDVQLANDQQSLAEFLLSMDNYVPIIPDAVTDYYLTRAGFECEDERIKRLLALAAQKFIADIATDALQNCKNRQVGKKSSAKDKKNVLTMEDLTPALKGRGINTNRAEYLEK